MNQAFISEIAEAVWEWDPYGVNDLRREVPEEYDSLIDSLIRRLRRNGSLQELTDWQLETIEELGLTPEPESESRFIRRAWDAFQRNSGERRG